MNNFESGIQNFFSQKKIVTGALRRWSPCSGRPSGRLPENKRGPVVFWLKKCEKFRIRHPIFCISKNFDRTNAVENALCTKQHFFQWKNGKFILKKSKKSQISESLQSYFLAQKFKKNIFFPRHLRRLGMFGTFGDFGALFSFKENKKCKKKVGLRCIP